MKSINDMLVFEHEDEVTLVRKERHIELTGPGYFARIERPFSQSVVRLVAALEKPRYGSEETLALVRYGHDELARFETLDSANLFVARLQGLIQELMIERDKEFNGVSPSSPAGKVALAIGKRVSEWLGIVVTGGALAFTASVLVYPGWKFGEQVFGEFVQSPAQYEQAQMEQEARLEAVQAHAALLSAGLDRLEGSHSSQKADFEMKRKEQEAELAKAWDRAYRGQAVDDQ